ncbi:MAG TPA: preprotein translocase subunit SecE [Candidatus Acidoferrales bacterium]|nr:preprotein translocase subunit SecE [Candidatus Acidoferrales bacterium]
MATRAVKVNNEEREPSAIVQKVTGTFQNSRDFLKEVRVEMKQVTWPTRDDVVSTTWVVIGTVAFFGLFLAVVDWIVQHGVERLLKFFGG